jgi:hypothetical protein
MEIIGKGEHSTIAGSPTMPRDWGIWIEIGVTSKYIGMHEDVVGVTMYRRLCCKTIDAIGATALISTICNPFDLENSTTRWNMERPRIIWVRKDHRRIVMDIYGATHSRHKCR